MAAQRNPVPTKMAGCSTGSYVDGDGCSIDSYVDGDSCSTESCVDGDDCTTYFKFCARDRPVVRHLRTSVWDKVAAKDAVFLNTVGVQKLRTALSGHY